MGDKLDELIKQFMEEIKTKKAIETFLQNLRQKHAHVSPQILIELGHRVDAAKSEEEKKQIIEKFIRDMMSGEITLYQ